MSRGELVPGFDGPVCGPCGAYAGAYVS